MKTAEQLAQDYGRLYQPTATLPIADVALEPAIASQLSQAGKNDFIATELLNELLIQANTASPIPEVIRAAFSALIRSHYIFRCFERSNESEVAQALTWLATIGYEYNVFHTIAGETYVDDLFFQPELINGQCLELWTEPWFVVAIYWQGKMCLPHHFLSGERSHFPTLRQQLQGALILKR